MEKENCFIGLDVGSYSVRAAVFNNKGKMLAQSSSPIEVYNSSGECVEQSSNNIWDNTRKVIQAAVRNSGVKPDHIKAVGFDATCSLVALGEGDQPVTVSLSGDENRNIIMWMDHRALKETKEINETHDEVLDYVGGRISPEMEVPKILWLKRNLKETYQNTKKFLDLADFLVYKASGNDVRSVCTKVCKWTYLAHKKSWSHEFFKRIQLDDVFDHNRLGSNIEDISKSAGSLSEDTAKEFGLSPDCIVSVGIIDAHAGGVGLLGREPETTIAIISGTSSCHMAVSKDPIFVKGVWGPYYGAMIPGMWLNEGGQSAAGSLLDHIIENSACCNELEKEADELNKSVYEILNEEVLRLEEKGESCTENLHMLGYFYGNRSPRANPNLKGMISGLTLSKDKSSLARLYMAAIQSLAYGTRHIIEEMNKSGHKISKIRMCGGGSKNSLFLREHADSTSCAIELPAESEAVLLGCAMLAATASGEYDTLSEAMTNMSSVSQTIQPRVEFKDYHEKKYKIFHEMYNDQIKYEEMMK